MGIDEAVKKKLPGNFQAVTEDNCTINAIYEELSLKLPFKEITGLPPSSL